MQVILGRLYQVNQTNLGFEPEHYDGISTRMISDNVECGWSYKWMLSALVVRLLLRKRGCFKQKLSGQQYLGGRLDSNIQIILTGTVRHKSQIKWDIGRLLYVKPIVSLIDIEVSHTFWIIRRQIPTRLSFPWIVFSRNKNRVSWRNGDGFQPHS